ncbi:MULTISPECIES: Fic family protein [unclassified Actinomyces]|uniref:Fic family protein n=1 Tax=unclassified Actinomyces TaxID=2609248 RepID=UPI0002EA6DCA|nr:MULTISPECIES: Fic family protein [unclassified Actinomyces]
MKTPVPPPYRLDELRERVIASLANADDERHLFVLRALAGGLDDPEYRPWEYYFRAEPVPDGLMREEWWYAVRTARASTARPTPFIMTDGTRLTFNLPDRFLRLNEEITAQARGQVELPAEVATQGVRDRYLINSLYEEAITSSQMEGASTTRRDAKKMLREKKDPRTRSERMILNNFLALEFVRDHLGEELTPEFICGVHRIVTDGTLDEAEDAGRLQRQGEERIRIYGSEGDEQLLHVPPPAEELPERLQRLCDFANGVGEYASQYVPPLVRALVVHFMMGYDHYFVDGNGRTARVIAQWVMLREGFFLMDFVPVSRLLHKAPAQYARSFLEVEQDEGDLTYFLIWHAEVMCRAIRELHEYLARKSKEMGQMKHLLRRTELNNRQIGVIEEALKDSAFTVTAAAHADRYRVTLQTAHVDLRGLEDGGYLMRVKRGRSFEWYPVPDLQRRVQGVDE